MTFIGIINIKHNVHFFFTRVYYVMYTAKMPDVQRIDMILVCGVEHINFFLVIVKQWITDNVCLIRNETI